MILIVGCNGHVGSQIMRKAADRGIQARCFDVQPPAVLPPEFVAGDVTDAAAVAAALDGVETVLFAVGLKRQTRHLTHEHSILCKLFDVQENHDGVFAGDYAGCLTASFRDDYYPVQSGLFHPSSACGYLVRAPPSIQSK